MMKLVPVVAVVLAGGPALAYAQAADPSPAPEATPAKTADKPDNTTTVVVTARKPAVTNKIDRRVYDVSAQSSFATVNDVLGRIPSVTIDPRGRIALRGDTQVKVLIDGTEARSGVLSNLQASDIDRVEVMTNPSAQFSSDGSGGIINIILKKKRKDGLNGIWSTRGNEDGRYSMNASFSYKTGRWTTAAAVGIGRTDEATTSRGYQQWQTATGQETTWGASRSTESRRQAYENASVTYDLSDRDKFELSLNHYRWRGTSITAGTVLMSDDAGMVLEDHTEDVFSPDRGHGAEWTAHYQHKGAAEGERFDLNISRNTGWSSDGAFHRLVTTVPSPSDLAYGYDNTSPDSDTTLKGDYERPFGRSRLTAGFQIEANESKTLSRSDNISAIVPGENDYSSTFDYERRTLAAYVTWQTPLGRWVVMPGLRVESDRWDAAASEHDDLRWLPSLNLNRDLSERTKLVASYSHRTQRPNGYQLNPRRVYYSRYFAYEGNPDLASQDTDSSEIGYEFVGKDFSSNGSVYYRVNKNPVSPTRRVSADQVVISTVINADEARAAGLELTAKGKAFQVVDYSVNFNVFDSELTGMTGGAMLRRQNTTFSGNAVVDYKPNPKDWWQFNLDVEGRSLTLQGYKTGFHRLDLTYRRKLTPKWTFSVRAFDLLNSSKQTNLFVTSEGQSYEVSRTERPAIVVGIARKFGNGAQ